MGWDGRSQEAGRDCTNLADLTRSRKRNFDMEDVVHKFRSSPRKF